jgi:peptidoglycan/LPS O-acetylase OafA/YrhL
MELVVVSSFGLLLILLRSLNESFRSSVFGKLLMSLGAISYSLYLIHQCNIRFIAEIAGYVLPVSWTWSARVFQIALHILMAIPFYFLFERPFLNKSLVSETMPATLPASQLPLLESMGTPVTEAAQ